MPRIARTDAAIPARGQPDQGQPDEGKTGGVARPAPKPAAAPAWPDYRRERSLMRKGFRPVAGVDEAGRGPLAGPVVACAVVLDPKRIPNGLADSKLLTAARRDELYEEILATADVAVASMSAARIDATDIRKASLEAMRRALGGLVKPPGYILVDGRDLPAWDGPGEAVVKGDRLVCSIAAASIVAKVTRDRLMMRLGRHYPAYGFERHAGYATAAHRSALAENGPCPFHRFTFSPLGGAIVNEE
jgi:ribonuclease HII